MTGVRDLGGLGWPFFAAWMLTFPGFPLGGLE